MSAGCCGDLHCNPSHRFCNPDSEALSLDVVARMLPLAPIGQQLTGGKMAALVRVTQLAAWTLAMLAVATSIVAVQCVVREDQ